MSASPAAFSGGKSTAASFRKAASRSRNRADAHPSAPTSLSQGPGKVVMVSGLGDSR
jgi:hypothetical protein